MTNIKTVVRARPQTMEEVDQNSKNIVRMKGDVVEIIQSNAGEAMRFNSDKAIWSCNTFLPGNRNENCTQEAFYDQVGFPMLEGAFKGISACVVAYGGHDSGKSYSLLGVPSDDGLIPRIGNDLFQLKKKAEKAGNQVTVECTFVETLGDQVRCLLNPDPRGFDGKQLSVREHPVHGSFVEGVYNLPVNSAHELLRVVSEGNSIRVSNMSMGKITTSAVFTFHIIIKKDDVVSHARLAFCELADSERPDSGLAPLIGVMTALSAKKQPNYSKCPLTLLLKDHILGKSDCTFLISISPSASCYKTTVNSLKFGDLVRSIPSTPVVNQFSLSAAVAALTNERKANPQDALVELISKLFAMNVPGTDVSDSVMLEREHNIQALREYFEKMSGSEQPTTATNRNKKNLQIDNLVSQLGSAGDEEKEALREQIAELEAADAAAAPDVSSPLRKKDNDAFNSAGATGPVLAAISKPTAVPVVEEDGQQEVFEDDIEFDDDDLADFEADVAAQGEEEEALAEEQAGEEAEEEVGEDDIDIDDDDIDIDDADLEAAMEEEAAVEEEPAIQGEESGAEDEDETPAPAAAVASPKKPSPAPVTTTHPPKATVPIIAPSTEVCTIMVSSHDLPNNRYLKEPFRVVKIGENKLFRARKDRVWEIDFFNKKFSNMDLTGYESFAQQASNLYRVEKHASISNRATLYFFEAAHPYDLAFTSSERRQRFCELAMLLRRNSVLWCPSLIPENETDAVVQVNGTTIDRPNGKVMKVKGEVQFNVAKMPYEVIDLWYGCLSLDNKPLPRSQTALQSFMPKAAHEVYVLGITNVPSHYMGTTEISDYFVSYLGPSLFFVLTSTAAAPQDRKKDVNNVFIVICRRSFIVRMSHLEAMDINSVRKDGLSSNDFSAVGCTLRINEASLGFVLVNATPDAIEPSVRAAAVRGIMSNFPFGDTSLDIGVRFDYFIVSGALGFGEDFSTNDMLVKQMKAGNLMSDMKEENAPSNVSSRANPMRIFYMSRPRICRLDVKSYQSSRAIEGPNVYANIDVFCQRPFLSTFGQQVPRVRLFFKDIVAAGARIPQINQPEVHLSGEWVDASPAIAPLQKDADLYSLTKVGCPAICPVVSSTEYLRLQHIDFTIYGTLPTTTDKKKIVIASGTLPLKNVATLGESVEFSFPLYYRGCNVGSLQGEVSMFFNESIASDLEAAGLPPHAANMHIVECFENQMLLGGQWIPANEGKASAIPWSTMTELTTPSTKESFSLPSVGGAWRWGSEWRVEKRNDDIEGWGYGLVMRNAVEKKKKEHTFRRRRWVRAMHAPSATALHEFIKSNNEAAAN